MDSDTSLDPTETRPTDEYKSHHPVTHPEGQRCALDLDLWPCITAQRDEWKDRALQAEAALRYAPLDDPAPANAAETS